jgi:hypothetical protein
VAEAQGDFGNPEESERLPLKDVTRGLLWTKLTEKAKSVS